MSNFFTRLFSKNQPEPEVETRGVTNDVSMFLQSYTGSTSLNTPQILRVFSQSPVFFACVNLVSSSVASADYKVLKNGRLLNEFDTDKIVQVVEKPNSFQSQNTFLYLFAAYLLTVGETFVWVRKDNTLVCLPPTAVQHTGGTSYNLAYGGQTRQATLHKDLVRVLSPDLANPFSSGTGLGEVNSQELDSYEKTSTHISGHLENGAVPSLFINHAGMSDDNLRKLKSGFDKNFKGSSNAGKTAFSNSDSLEVQQISSKFKDLGLTEIKKASADAIRQSFGIPPELLGHKTPSQRTGLEAAEYIYMSKVVKPRVDKILDIFNDQIIPIVLGKKNLAYKVYVEGLIPQDKRFELEVAKTFIKGIPPHMTINEARELQNLPAVKGGDGLGGKGTPIELKEERKPLMCAPNTGSVNEQRYFKNKEEIKSLMNELNRG